MDKEAINRWVLLLLVFFISALFLSMISQFLMAIFLAGIFSALAYPLFRRFERWFKGRRSLASIATLLLIVFVVVLPLGGLLGIVAAQAIKVGETVRPWVQQQLAEPDAITSALKSLPFYDRVEPYRNLILKKAGELVGITLLPHDLRRHAATYASRSGVPIEIVSKVILRHSSLAITQIYLGKVSDLEAMKWIENLYG